MHPQPPKGGRARRLALGLALLFGSTALTLAAAELLLRAFDYPKPAVSGWKTLDAPKSELNQMGFRGHPIEYADEDFVILLVGDSQVEAGACAYGWMPERRLQFHLSQAGRRVKVFSMGGPATGQDQQLLSLRDYLGRYRADLVILWFTPANDVWNNTFPSSIPDDRTPKPTFWLEGGELRGPTELTGQPPRELPALRLARLWRKRFPYPRERVWEEKILPPPYAPLGSYEGPASDDWQRRLDALPGHLRYEHFDNDKNDRSLQLTPRSPRVQYGLDLTRRLLREMSDLTASRGGRFVIFSAGPGVPGGAPGEVVHALNGKFYKTSDAQYVENIDYLMRGFQTYSVRVTVEPWEVGPEDAHLNEHANDQVMRDLASQLEPLLPPARGR